MRKTSQPVRQKNSDKQHPKSLIALVTPIPLLFAVVVAITFLIFQRFVPSKWAIHVDGYGNVTYGSWWWLFTGVFVLVALSFLLGQYLARDFNALGHWYPQQKSIVITCFSVGYGILGFLIFNMVSAWNVSKNATPPTVEDLMGYGLLGFVLTALISAVLYTKLLPKAKSLARQRDTDISSIE